MYNKAIYQTTTIYKYVKTVFPLVNCELSYWKDFAEKMPDPILSQQALESINKKGFHAQGGSIYGLYNGTVNTGLVRFIVALQTISDYLDNLCDRVGVEDELAFLRLHDAISDALSADDVMSDYYSLYPHKQDGGYLTELVFTCKKFIKSLPNYDLVKQETALLGKLYSEMQSFKHVNKSQRVDFLTKWADPYLQIYSNISVWEFSAAAGSTLGIFLLCALSEDKNLTKEQVSEVMNTYFPWICGLHILLDYFIDEQEDSLNNDLNFTSFYSSGNEKEERLKFFLNQSFENSSCLKNQLFHTTVIEGLLAMYLSDPKASQGLYKAIGDALLIQSSKSNCILYKACKLLRRNGIVLSN